MQGPEARPQSPPVTESAPPVPEESESLALPASDVELVEFARKQLEAIAAEADAMTAEPVRLLDHAITSLAFDAATVAEVRAEIGADTEIAAIVAETEALRAEAARELTAAAHGEDAVAESKTEQRPVAERARELREATFGITAENAAEFVRAFNAEHPEGFTGLELSLLHDVGEQLVVVDEAGTLRLLAVDEQHANEVLTGIKRIDEEVRGNSYELRQKLVERSGGRIPTHEAYTYGAAEGLRGAALKQFLDNPEHWVPERRALHEAIVEEEFRKALALSERLGDPRPAVYALRGNTAAGKTTRLRGDPTFAKALDARGQPSGAINPDTYKESLKRSEAAFGRQTISHRQTHPEGSMLARRTSARIKESESSMIIDQRLNEEADITQLVAEAERTGKEVKFLDVDAPLEASLIRVLARKVGGADPLVPFEAVAEGFEGVRKNRAALIEEVRRNDRITHYVLYATDRSGKSVKVAEKRDGAFTVLEGQEDAFAQVVNSETQGTTEALRTAVIDDAYIERATQEMGLPAHMSEALRKYHGRTFEDALREHAQKINEEPPTLGAYLAAAERNLTATSRTARGTVDTSASPDKAAKMAEGLTAEVAADRATENFREAITTAHSERGRQFANPTELRTFIEGIAQTVNRGITKEGILIRAGEDSPKYPYTKVADLEGAMQQFYNELSQRLRDPKEDPVALAAWAEYRIDLSDHFFADGCGKTAKAISSWILMRADRPLPAYRGRDEYYAHAPTAARSGDTASDEPLQRWTDYYRTLQT